MSLILSLLAGAQLVAGWDDPSPQTAPIVIEEPTTLELALVGGLILAIYSVVGRIRRRRREDGAGTTLVPQAGHRLPGDPTPTREAA